MSTHFGFVYVWVTVTDKLGLLTLVLPKWQCAEKRIHYCLWVWNLVVPCLDSSDQTLAVKCHVSAFQCCKLRTVQIQKKSYLIIEVLLYIIFYRSVRFLSDVTMVKPKQVWANSWTLLTKVSTQSTISLDLCTTWIVPKDSSPTCPVLLAQVLLWWHVVWLVWCFCSLHVHVCVHVCTCMHVRKLITLWSYEVALIKINFVDIKALCLMCAVF